MKIACLLIDNNNYLSDKEKARFLDITLKKVEGITKEIYYISNMAFSPPSGIKILDISKSFELLKFFRGDLKETDLVIMNAFSPLFDLELTRKMILEHSRYVFDYTYTENMPDGLLPEIVNTGVADFLIKYIPEDHPLFNKSFKELLGSELSSFDCNIFITDSEISKYRVDFLPQNPSSYFIVNTILDKYGVDVGIKDIEKIILEDPLIIRYRPTYYEIELSTQREKGDMFASALLKREGYMDLGNFKNILGEIKRFSFNPVVSLGLYGEPFLHPEINKIVELVADFPGIEFIFESRGIFLETLPVEKALELKNVRIIFDVSFTDGEKFKKYKTPLNKLLPEKNFSKLEEEIKSFSQKEKIYIQFTRCKENEEEIMKFYEKWKDYRERIIIKKLDTFCGRLDDFRVVDLSPVKRFFCYHLKNDMVIFYNGDVPLCRQDLNGINLAGNVFENGIEKCWDNMKRFYFSHFRNEFVPEEFCSKCDEWWIFNF